MSHKTHCEILCLSLPLNQPIWHGSCEDEIHREWTFLYDSILWIFLGKGKIQMLLIDNEIKQRTVKNKIRPAGSDQRILFPTVAGLLHLWATPKQDKRAVTLSHCRSNHNQVIRAKPLSLLEGSYGHMTTKGFHLLETAQLSFKIIKTDGVVTVYRCNIDIGPKVPLVFSRCLQEATKEGRKITWPHNLHLAFHCSWTWRISLANTANNAASSCLSGV